MGLGVLLWKILWQREAKPGETGGLCQPEDSSERDRLALLELRPVEAAGSSPALMCVWCSDPGDAKLSSGEQLCISPPI